MSEFGKYYDKHFKVDKNGDVCSIRNKCFNGNGLLQSICEGDLEKIWDHQQQKIEELEKQNQDLIEGFKVLVESNEVLEEISYSVKTASPSINRDDRLIEYLWAMVRILDTQNNEAVKKAMEIINE